MLFSKERFNLLCFLLGMLFITTATAQEVSYSVHFSGVPDPSMEETMESTSDLFTLKNNSPIELSALRQRADGDQASLIKVLHSEGYYDGKVNFLFHEEQDQVIVTIQIEPGTRYILSSYRLLPEFSIDAESPFGTFPLDRVSSEDLKIQIGQPAVAEDIIQAEERLLSLLANEGYPLALIVERKIVADRATKTLSVTLIIDSGPEVTFGEVTITGLRKVRERFVRKKIAWNEGEVFSPGKLRETTEDLEDSRLFTSVMVTYSSTPAADYSLPISIQLTERLHRTIGAGVNYRTDRGLGLIGEWENRNLRGVGELLNFKIDLRDSDQDGTVNYRKQDFGSRDQDLLLIGNIHQERTENYSVMSFSGTGLIEKMVNPQLKIFYGASIKKQKTSKSDNNQTNTLLNVPVGFNWRATDSLVNPSEGYALNFTLTPNYDLEDDNTFFVKQWMAFSSYHSLSSSKRLILALQMTLGTINGSSRINVPPPDRFYAGDENLLRGYSYHTISPLDDHFIPEGGRSLLVASAEARVRINQDWAWVAFFEAGNVYSTPLPRLDQDQLRSAGLGLRYHTPIGPLRLDAAFPLDKRKGIDSDFEVYLSIGHTF